MAEIVLAEPNGIDPAVNARLFAWLAASSPDDWHYLVGRWNYDFGIHPLVWIIQRPDCDKATAQQMFFQVADWLLLWDSARKEGKPLPQNDEMRLLDYIIARWEADGFPRSELASAQLPHAWGMANIMATQYGVPPSLGEVIVGRKAAAVPWGEEMPAGIEAPR